MYAPSARSTLDALRAELDAIWRAADFDVLAYAQCTRAIRAELTRLGLGKGLEEYERRVLAGKKAHATRLANGTNARGGWKVRRETRRGKYEDNSNG